MLKYQLGDVAPASPVVRLQEKAKTWMAPPRDRDKAAISRVAEVGKSVHWISGRIPNGSYSTGLLGWVAVRFWLHCRTFFFVETPGNQLIKLQEVSTSGFRAL